jgi:hypothetical protein
MPRKTKGIRPVGPPSKKTPEIVQKMIEVARTGVPLRFVAAAGGVAQQTLTDWRDSDPAFGLAIEQARSESVRERWEAIKRLGLGTKNSQPNWAALAWQLERSFPHEFGKPEAQLNLQVNSQTNNALVITTSQAEEFEQRSRKINSEIDALLEERKARFSSRHQADTPPASAQDRVIDAQAEVVPEPITLPPPEQRTASWWRQFSHGSSERPIAKEVFRYVLEKIAVALRGPRAASQLDVDLGTDQLILGDLHSALQEVGGSAAWELLVSLGVERER